LSRDVLKNLKDQENHNLAQLLSADATQTEAKVKAVVISALGKTGQESLQICVSGNQLPSMSCLAKQNVETKEGVLSFTIAGSQLKNLTLVSVGRIKVRTIRIIFE